jgi:LCP family protein required for cell wall assembly
MHNAPRFDRRAAIAAACLVSLALITTVLLATHFGRQYAGRVAARLTLGTRPVNILLIANNARGVAANDPLGLGTAAGQADVILLARAEPATHTIYAITIPRDALVAQPHWHNPVPKIKTLFFMGDQETPARGPVYLSRAVSALTGLPIDGYVVANFAGFKEAVDAVGGLTVNVKARVYDPQNSGADFRPGIQHMNGGQALAFIRVRQNQAGNVYRVNDFQRMQAEVEVLGLLRNKLLDPTRAATLVPTFISRMKRDIATNLPPNRLARIGIAMAGAPVYQVPLGSIGDSMILARAAIPGIDADGEIDEADYTVLDPKAVQTRLAEFGSRSSSTGLTALPDRATLNIGLYGSPHVALHLAHQGFRHVRILGSSTGTDRVVYPPNHPEWGWEVARALGTGSSYVTPGDVSLSAVLVYE